MQLESFLKYPIKSWIYAERFVNEGSPSGYSHINQVSLPTHPVYGEPTFKIYCFKNSLAKVYYLTGRGIQEKTPPPPLKQEAIPIHPDMLTHESTAPFISSVSPECCLTCIPSSSGRTVFVLPSNCKEPQFFLKLHYGKLLGRFRRTLDRRRIISALNVNSDLVNSLNYFPSSIAFLPEYGAFLAQYNSGQTAEFGAIIRSLEPWPKSQEVEVIVPFFSLFSKDKKKPQAPVLLEQIFRRTHKPYEIFLEKLIQPLLQGFFFLSLYLGLIPEWNAQNLLLALTSNGLPNRIVFRDLQGTYRDLAYRASFLPKVDESEYKILSYKTWQHEFNAKRQHSYLFDFKFGEYVLEPLTNLTAELLNLSKSSLKQKIVELTMHEYDKYQPINLFFPDGKIWYRQACGISVKGPNFFKEESNPKFRLCQ